MPDQTMSAEDRVQVDKLALEIAFKSEAEPLTEAESALLATVRHLHVVESRNQAQGTELARLEKYGDIVSALQRYTPRLAQGIAVAESGTRVGEVTAMKAIYSDLTTVLTKPEEVH
jgi:hypothetical protein